MAGDMSRSMLGSKIQECNATIIELEKSRIYIEKGISEAEKEQKEIKNAHDKLIISFNIGKNSPDGGKLDVANDQLDSVISNLNNIINLIDTEIKKKEENIKYYEKELRRLERLISGSNSSNKNNSNQNNNVVKPGFNNAISTKRISK